MNELNAAVIRGQAAAIKHGDGPALVIAGPGSGKTYVITKRLEYLINTRQIKPSNILTITYTNAAAREMRSRAYSLLGGNAGGITFGTFHSVFYSILKGSFSLNASNILRPKDKYIMLCCIAKELGIEADDMGMVCDELSALISRSKNGLEVKSSFGSDMNDRITGLYAAKLKEMRVIDFDDMIIKCRNLFERDPALLGKWQERYRYIMVDEYQDCNLIQHETVKLLAGDMANLLTVGDDDQSIYAFRGANPGVLKKFLEDYPEAKVYELDTNFRCHAPIADAADRVIAENKDRIIKHHSSFNQTGEEVDIRCFKDRAYEISAIKQEADITKLKDCCLLVRTNEMASYFADELERSGIPVNFRGKRKSRYDTDTGKDVVSYLRIASGIYGRKDLLRIMNKPMRFFSREAFNKENAAAKDAVVYYKGNGKLYDNALRFDDDMLRMGRMSPKAAMRYLMKVVGYERFLKAEGRDTNDLYMLYDAASGYSSIRQWLCEIDDEKERRTDRDDNPREKAGMSVMTLHASKGLEFDEVFIADVNEGIIPYHRAKLTEETEEERRLLYVGMTRAVRKLHLFCIEQSIGKPLSPSSFLKELFDRKAFRV